MISNVIVESILRLTLGLDLVFDHFRALTLDLVTCAGGGGEPAVWGVLPTGGDREEQVQEGRHHHPGVHSSQPGEVSHKDEY